MGVTGMFEFKKDCLLYNYKRKSGEVKNTSILHRPSGLRVEKNYSVGQADPDSYNSITEELFALLKMKVDNHEKITEFLKRKQCKGAQDV